MPTVVHPPIEVVVPPQQPLEPADIHPIRELPRLRVQVQSTAERPSRIHQRSRELEVFLRRQLSHYGVDVVPTATDPRHLDRATKDWAWACHQLGIEDREPILQRHDKRVLAWLSATTEDDPKHAPLIVTWDRVLRAARPESAPGGALDPLATSELLSFVAGAREPPITARFASLQLTEIEAEKGAAILDTLISLERSGLSDAALAQKAQAFKRAYIDNPEIRESAAALERAWRAFQRP